MAGSASIYFHSINRSFYLPNRNKLKYFLNQLFIKEGFTVVKVNYIFSDDKYVAQINRQFLDHNSYTDIITFPLSSEEHKIISDIYISIDRVKENAKTFQATFTNELHRVIFHGALHLCGYKDKTKQQQQEMREKENFYLGKYFVSRETKFL